MDALDYLNANRQAFDNEQWDVFFDRITVDLDMVQKAKLIDTMIESGIDFIPDLQIIPTRFFEGCTRLPTTLCLDNVRTLYREALAETKCKAIDLSKSKITIVSEMCFWESNVEEVYLPDVTNLFIGMSAFGGCQFLKKISTPNDDTFLSLEGYNFYDCVRLKEINIPKGVSNIPKGCFSHCSLLEKVTFSDYVDTVCEKAFRSCASLSAINLPYGLDTIGPEAFYTSGLKEITLTKSIKNILSDAFSYCDYLEKIIFEADNPNVVYLDDDWCTGCDNLKEVVFPDKMKGLTPAHFFSFITRDVKLTSNLTAEQFKEININENNFKGKDFIIKIHCTDGVLEF